MAVQLAAEVAELDELRQLALAACGRDLVRPLAELRRDRAVAEVRIELVLGRVRHDLAGLDVRDAVLRDGHASPLCVLA